MKNINLCLIVFLTAASFNFSQIDLVINDGMTVEMIGVVSVELSGNLIENGSGYLKGTVESGSRTNETDFAGLSFASGFTGTIKRTTGSSYSKGNGEGTNFKRYYELNNTGGSTITDDLTVSAKTSGAHDESNSLTGPFFLYSYDQDWIGNGEGSSGPAISADNVALENGTTDLVISSGTGINSKIFLAGAYNGGTPPMSTSLNGSLPLTSPYSEDSRTVSSIPADAVDWVLIQLRETSNGPAIASRSAFLKNDGMLISDDGSDAVGINAAPGSYFIVLKHRNHLPVMSASAQSGLTWGTIPSLYDFTLGSGQFWGGSAGAAEL